MAFKFVFLWTDIAIFLLLVCIGLYIHWVRRDASLAATWRNVLRETTPMCASVILLCFLAVGLVDSMHFRLALPPAAGVDAGKTAYSPRTSSVLDLIMARQINSKEKTYSAPLATHSFSKESMLVDGVSRRDFPRLKYGGIHIKNPQQEWRTDVLQRSAWGLTAGALAAVVTAFVFCLAVARRSRISLRQAWGLIVANQTELALQAALITLAVILLLAGLIASLAQGYHAFGTDRTGNDVLYVTMKSIRTALVFGSLTTLATLPIGIVLGITAGYFKGWVDDVIQYVYTVLNSIPSVLLIAAFVLILQVYIDTNPQLFETGVERADLRIFFLCLILGVTSWTGLCRLLRGETLKLRELEYIQAAQAFGVSHWRIMVRHILPNVMHLVLITTVLEFSGIVLYEAVLSYIGVGVDPTTQSFGSMINLARLELSRDPMVWWSLSAAFIFMIAIVLPANLLADAVREAFDPRARLFRPRLTLKPAAVMAGQPAAGEGA